MPSFRRISAPSLGLAAASCVIITSKLLSVFVAGSFPPAFTKAPSSWMYFASLSKPRSWRIEAAFFLAASARRTATSADFTSTRRSSSPPMVSRSRSRRSRSFIPGIRRSGFTREQRTRQKIESLTAALQAHGNNAAELEAIATAMLNYAHTSNAITAENKKSLNAHAAKLKELEAAIKNSRPGGS